MQTKFGAIIVSGTGKLGGCAFSGKGANSKVSVITPRITPKYLTKPQLRFERSKISLKQWKALTMAQRKSFNDNVFQGKRGFNLFVYCNRFRVRQGVTTFITSFVNNGAIPLYNQCTATWTKSTNAFVFSNPQFGNTNFNVAIYISFPFFPNTAKARKHFVYLSNSTNSANPVTLTTQIAALGIPIPLTGQVAFCRIVPYDQRTGLATESYEFPITIV